MKRKLFHGLMLAVFAMLLQGCISIPPLIQVQHKEDNHGDLNRRLAEIERRLEKIDNRLDKQ